MLTEALAPSQVAFSTTGPRPNVATHPLAVTTATLHHLCSTAPYGQEKATPVVQGRRGQDKRIARFHGFRWGRDLMATTRASGSHVGVVRYRRSDLHLESRPDSLAVAVSRASPGATAVATPLKPSTRRTSGVSVPIGRLGQAAERRAPPAAGPPA